MTPTGTCTECNDKFQGWALETDHDCECGGKIMLKTGTFCACGQEIKVESNEIGGKTYTEFYVENSPFAIFNCPRCYKPLRKAELRRLK